jgi:Fe-S cluster assembly protein SufD
VPSFDVDAARALSAEAPDLAKRLAAAERAAGAPFPSPDEEIWRYSRIAELDLERFTPVRASTTVTGGESSAVEIDTTSPSGDEDFTDPAGDLFGALNDAFHTAITIRVPAGKAVAEPILVTHQVDGEGLATFPRLVIDADADSEITVVERFVSANGDRALVVPVVSIRARQAARVKYVAVNELGPKTWQIGGQQAIAERDATLLLGTVALGGDYARVRTDARLTGQGASARQIAIYFAGGSQMHDFRTLQDHAAPRTNSDLLFKGAVQDTAKSVYTGLIKIRENAKGSNAFQTNRNLTLSEGAWAESVPNLDIATNDVKCSHASTVGPVDVDQRFYLESRGVPPDVAERLVVLGFFGEVLEQLPIGDLATSLSAQIGAKLSARTRT